MEEHVRSTGHHSPNLSTKSCGYETLSSNALVRMRALIINPSTPDSTISSAFDTLAHSLQLNCSNKLVVRHILKLLHDLASHHTRFSRLVFDSVRSHSLLSTESVRVAVEALDVVASVAERDGALVPALDELDDGFFAALCFSPSVSVRPWLLRNAERLHVRPYLLFTLFLGFTKDPHPYVRKAALDGLAGLSRSSVIDDQCMIRDAIPVSPSFYATWKIVCAWGLTLVASNLETKVYCSNEVFVKLCSMTRDMSMEVRVEVFNSLGKIEMVSEDILLQTMSKKVLGISKGKLQFEELASSAAGTFVHGLEDEFHELLGSLVDKNSSIRSATRKILKLVKLPVFKLFKFTVDALLENLETSPQDEADVFSILFHIGRNHGKFVDCIIQDVYQQVEPTSEGKLVFDSSRVVALLVLAISAPLA
ncbi:hypothetical protein FNV43_RR09607 [Rhamnella rubrinervis]|uniref:Uncharacterized protein n=1 Tax=Rhamnella rubrinervis TaxID=2594499 RepID=A0A8K0HAA0_9ROSA|nr:hypothetical protein FNV43_RR09607 [Rhamnella rubrinervis]